jgi:hypothetical protein
MVYFEKFHGIKYLAIALIISLQIYKVPIFRYVKAELVIYFI